MIEIRYRDINQDTISANVEAVENLEEGAWYSDSIVVKAPAMGVLGYKVFRKDWTCRDFQYEVGKEYSIDGHPVICSKGFHFCPNLKDCFKYYLSSDAIDKNTGEKLYHIAQVIGYDELAFNRFTHNEDGIIDKFCAKRIYIAKEISYEEAFGLINSGINNIGVDNIGSCNIGDFNKGSLNFGMYNNGNGNNGNKNTGDNNVGHENEGNDNHGSNNKGYGNHGHSNIGYYNQGNDNKGDCNCGDGNIGSYNHGCYNRGYNHYGNFCTDDCVASEKSNISYLFNKPMSAEDESIWDNIDYNIGTKLLVFIVYCYQASEWGVEDIDFSDEDIVDLIQYRLDAVVGGKTLLEWIYSIPHFDRDIFEEITGVDLRNFGGK